MSNATLGLIGTLGGAFLLLVSTVIGLWLKFKSDKQARIDESAQKDADRRAAAEATRATAEQARAQAVFDQMQEQLEANRTELRAMQADLTKTRQDMGVLWTDMASVRRQLEITQRQLEAAETYIVEIHRWDDGGRVGSMPTRKTV